MDCTLGQGPPKYNQASSLRYNQQNRRVENDAHNFNSILILFYRFDDFQAKIAAMKSHYQSHPLGLGKGYHLVSCTTTR